MWHFHDPVKSFADFFGAGLRIWFQHDAKTPLSYFTKFYHQLSSLRHFLAGDHMALAPHVKSVGVAPMPKRVKDHVQWILGYIYNPNIARLG